MEKQLEIRVRSDTSCNSLAASIAAAYTEGKAITLAAIGAAAVGQAVKGVCVANRALASKGVILAILPGLVTRNILDKHQGNEERPWVITLMHLKNMFASENASLLKEDAGS